MPVGSQGSFVPAASLTVVVPAGPGSSLPLPAVDGSNVSMMIQNNGGYLQLNWGAPAATHAKSAEMKVQMRALLAQHLDATRKLDAVLTEAREAAERCNSIVARIVEADQAAGHARHALEDEGLSNALLASAHRSTWPRFPCAGTHHQPALRVEIVTESFGHRLAVIGRHDVVSRKSATEMAGPLHWAVSSAIGPMPDAAA